MRKTGNWAWIKTEADRSGRNILDVATAIGVSETAVNNWMRGEKVPSLDSFVQLASLFTHGSLDALAQKAHISIEHLVAMDAQLRASKSVSAQPLPLLTLQVPLDLLFSDNPDIARVSAETVINSNRLLFHKRRYSEAMAQARAVLNHLVGQKSVLSAQMYCDLAYAEIMLGDYEAGTEMATVALEADHGRLPKPLQADIHLMLTETYRSMGELAQSRTQADQAQALYVEAGVDRLAEGPLWANWNLARLAGLEGKLYEAERRCDEVREMAQRSKHPDVIALEIWSRANTAEMRGQLNEAIAQYRQAKAHCHKIDYFYWEVCSDWRIAESLRKKGALDEAMHLATATAAAFAELGNSNLVATMELILAACHLQRGEWRKATQLYQKAVRQARQDGDLSMIYRTALGLALIQFAQMSKKSAPDFRAWLPSDDHVTLAARSENWSIRAYQTLLHAEALRLCGRADEAHLRYQALAYSYAASGHQIEHAHALLGMAEAQRVLGQCDRANAQAALALYRKTDTAWGQIHALIALALAESGDSGLAASRLHEARQLAIHADFRPEVNYINSLEQSTTPHRVHVLVFV